MHTIAVQLAPVLAAEKSKVPFYIAGGLLVLWALFVSLGVGARRSDFPDGLSQQRGVIAVTAVLVLAAVATAVITSGGTTSSEASAGAGAQNSTAAAPAEAPASTQTPAATAPASTATTTTPKATTGTPAPASSPAAGGSSLNLSANTGGQLSYDTKQLSAKAGNVTIAFTNSSPLEHNVTIAQGSKVLGATPTFAGGAKSLRVQLAPGKYTFYCSVPGHRQAGMEGTLTVS